MLLNLRRDSRTILGVLTLALSILTPPTWGSETPSEPFDRAGLAPWISAHSIGSVGDFLTQARLASDLPETVQQTFTPENQIFLFHSESLQGASPLAPRVILKSSDAKFLLATSEQSPTLEIIQFNDRTARFEFRSVRWTEGRPEFRKHDRADDPSCRSCHANRPNWDTYPNWPGVFGGTVQDQPRGLEPKIENRLVQDWIQKWGTLDSETTATRRTSERFYESLSSSPTAADLTQFTEQLAQLNVARIARMIVSAPNYARARYLIGSALNDCGDISTFPKPKASGLVQSWGQILRETQKRHRELFMDRSALLKNLHGLDHTDRGAIENSDSVAQLAYAAQFLGLSAADRFDTWSLNRPHLSLNRGPGYYRGFQAADPILFYRIFRELLRLDPRGFRPSQFPEGPNCTELKALAQRTR